MAPLSAGFLLEQAKQLGFLSAENKVEIPSSFEYMHIKRTYLYAKLIEKSVLDVHVLENITHSSGPRSDKDCESYATIYQYALLSHCSRRLNIGSYKIYVLDISESSLIDMKHCLKELHDAHRLTDSVFFAVINLVSRDFPFFLKTLNFLEKYAISNFFYCDTIYIRVRKFRYHIASFYQALQIIENALPALIDYSLIMRLLRFKEKTTRVFQSLHYLEQRTGLSPTLFMLILDFYENEPEPAPPAKKEYSCSGYQNFFAVKKSEKTLSFEISSVLYAFSETQLLQSHSGWIMNLTLPIAEFILQLFWLGELSSSHLTLASEAYFNKVSLKKILALAKAHIKLPITLPVNRWEYIDCLMFMKSSSCAWTPAIEAFAFQQPTLLKRVLTTLTSHSSVIIENLSVIVDCLEHHRDRPILFDSIITCAVLAWPMTEIESMADRLIAPEKFIAAIQFLKYQGIVISPSADTRFLLPDLLASIDPKTDAHVIASLFKMNICNLEIWATISELTSEDKLSYIPIITQLLEHKVCNSTTLSLIIASQKRQLALDIFLLLTTEQLPISAYWDTLMQHAHPLLLCLGLVELNTQKLLTAEYFLKIVQAKQPVLAAKALAQLLKAGITLENCWSDIANAENPEQAADIVINTAMPDTWIEELPIELRNSVVHHPQPKLARQHVIQLSTIPTLTTTHKLNILSRENAAVIVQALLELNTLISLNETLIMLIMNTPDMLGPLKAGLLLTAPSDVFFIQLCQSPSVKEAEHLVNYERLIRPYPECETLLRDMYKKASSTYQPIQEKLIQACLILIEINEMTRTSLVRVNSYASYEHPLSIAQLIRALKHVDLYHSFYFDRAMQKEKQRCKVLAALNALFERGTLNARLLRFVMINSNVQVIQAAEILLTIPDINPAHLDWLASVSLEMSDVQPIAKIIQKLHTAHLLSRVWLERMIGKTVLELVEPADLLQYIPDALLDKENVAGIFDSSGIIDKGENEDDEWYNPFKHFMEKNPSLLTKEVITLVLKKEPGNSDSVFSNMQALHDENLFRPEIIPYCNTFYRRCAIIALSKAGLLNETHLNIISSLNMANSTVEKIIYFSQQGKYSERTQALVARHCEMEKYSRYTSNQYHFSWKFDFIYTPFERNPALQETTLQTLIEAKVNLDSFKSIIVNYLKEEAITDTTLLLLAKNDQLYLKAFCQYRYEAFHKTKLSTTDISKLCDYAVYLNHPHLLSEIGRAIPAYRYSGSPPLNSEKMQHLLNDLEVLCQAGDQASIMTRILSPTDAVNETSPALHL